ncbi:MAG: hypothetical protein AAGJ93_03310 [Bacteroidota bacterium]
MRNLPIVILLLLFTFNLSAQKEETLFNQTRLGLSGAWGSAAYNYTSFTNDNWTLFRGGYGGVEFGRELFIGWGGYETTESFNLDDSNDSYNFRYHGPIVSLSPNATKMIHPRFTFITGTGRLTLDEAEGRDRMFVFQPSAGFEFNVFQWFRLGVEGGYRFVGSSDRFNVDGGELSAPFAQVELRFGLSWGN